MTGMTHMTVGNKLFFIESYVKGDDGDASDDQNKTFFLLLLK